MTGYKGLSQKERESGASATGLHQPGTFTGTMVIDVRFGAVAVL
jgi:hypothetical protein